MTATTLIPTLFNIYANPKLILCIYVPTWNSKVGNPNGLILHYYAEKRGFLVSVL
jgi:hypothetical protein